MGCVGTASWKYTGMLIIANLFGGMSVCISGVFNAVKDTKTLATTTVIGGFVNTILNDHSAKTDEQIKTLVDQAVASAFSQAANS